MTFGRSGAASVVLNVGGARYSLSRELLKDFPLRRVSRLHGCRSERDVLEVCDDYDRERNEYFFDRHSEAFGFILLYVRGHGKLRFAPRMCELSFYNEMIYWGLEGAHLEYCCQRRLDDRMSDTYTFYSADEPGALGRDEARPGGGEAAPSRRWLERMRRTFEEPTSSLAAQILASVSVVFVIVSMVVLCASTLPDWRAAAADNRSLDDRSRIIEAICIGWFTAECIVRFIVSKNKLGSTASVEPNTGLELTTLRSRPELTSRPLTGNIQSCGHVVFPVPHLPVYLVVAGLIKSVESSSAASASRKSSPAFCLGKGSLCNLDALGHGLPGSAPCVVVG
ncbi:voltage-gated potassium channel regulatory subunit KCNG3 isoform X6 [Canis lupus baileyi]|uniref:voltage-gated potassium channel regulatory subunit KCNG3 isoform X6 n=1 Tax=Canis lupus baileyi TaxID=143281 RepID=UPI003B975D7A